MSTSYMNIRIHQLVGNDDVILYPQTLDTNILIDTSNPSIPSGTSSVQQLVDELGGLAFEDTLGTNIDTGTTYAALRTSDDPTKNDSDIVASSKAVSTVNNSVVHITNDESVNGVKAFGDGINIGGAVQVTEEEDPEDSSKTIEVKQVIGGVNVNYDSATDTVTFS